MALEEAPDPGSGAQQLGDDRGRAMRPAEDDDVVGGRDRGDAGFELPDGLVQPLGEDRDEQSEEQDVAEHRHHGGDRAAGHALVVAQVAGIREPEKGPPHGLAQIREAGVERGDESPRDQGHRQHDRSREQQAVAETAQHQALETEAKPIAQSLQPGGTARSGSTHPWSPSIGSGFAAILTPRQRKGTAVASPSLESGPGPRVRGSARGGIGRCV